MKQCYVCMFVLLGFISCSKAPIEPLGSYKEDYIAVALQSACPIDSALLLKYADTGLSARIVQFAKTQLGVRYKYCSMDPKGGFDCSGFINYVFNHFNIKVPRSSVDFTNIGREIALAKSKPGDIILFTGTNSRIRTVGHIGLIVTNDNGNISFIQATSGYEYAVTISPLNELYMKRFVKVIRL